MFKVRVPKISYKERLIDNLRKTHGEVLAEEVEKFLAEEELDLTALRYAAITYKAANRACNNKEWRQNFNDEKDCLNFTSHSIEQVARDTKTIDEIILKGLRDIVGAASSRKPW